MKYLTRNAEIAVQLINCTYYTGEESVTRKLASEHGLIWKRRVGSPCPDHFSSNRRR